MFNVGDRVRINPGILAFRHGDGGVSHDDAGTVTYSGARDLRVDWDKGMGGWRGLNYEVLPLGSILLSRFDWYDDRSQEMKDMTEQELSDALAMIRSSGVGVYIQQANKTVTLERLLKEKQDV